MTKEEIIKFLKDNIKIETEKRYVSGDYYVITTLKIGKETISEDTRRL